MSLLGCVNDIEKYGLNDEATAGSTDAIEIATEIKEILSPQRFKKPKFICLSLDSTSVVNKKCFINHTSYGVTITSWRK